jgi:hypothetical protein
MRLNSLVAGLTLSLAVVGFGHAQTQNRATATNTNAPTFTKDVAPIMFAKCATCHRPGEVAPMSLLSYNDARPWASAIKQRVATRVMPPWHADPAHGTFRNDLRLSDREIDTIVRWVDGGAREGDPAALPSQPKFPEGWQIGTPEAVFEMTQDFEIPASGEIAYQYFEVPTNFTEDKWMQAGEVRAGDRSHVHHIIVSVREPVRAARPSVLSVRAIPNAAATTPAVAIPAPQAATPAPQSTQGAARTAAAAALAARAQGGARPSGGDATLVNWAVGEDAPIYLPGTAKRIPAGSTLVFQVHYTTNGKPGRDRSKVGLIFAKEPPQREIRTGMITNAGFAIPPGEANHSVEAEGTFSEDVKIYSMHPHMHLRGKDMTYTATYPDGRKEILLRVPKFDFGWQTDYWLAQPLSIPKGTSIRVTAHFDNSTANRANPDPKATVRWGDQTWEEMMIGYFTYTVESTK